MSLKSHKSIEPALGVTSNQQGVHTWPSSGGRAGAGRRRVFTEAPADLAGPEEQAQEQSSGGRLIMIVLLCDILAIVLIGALIWWLL